MIKFGNQSKITELKKPKSEAKENSQNKQSRKSATRPYVVDAKVYKVKSAFVKNSVFITLSYVKDNTEIRPIEIFINSSNVKYPLFNFI